MNQKGYVNIILVVLVIVLAGAVGYLTLVKKSPSLDVMDQLQSTDTTLAPNWEDLITEIKIALQQAFPEGILQDERIAINSKVDVTSNGVPEALVQTDCGATTCGLALMRLENNKPVVARFKQEDGKLSYLEFSEGSGGAGRYGSGVELVGDKNAIYFTHHFAYNESDDSCGAEVYQWNNQTKIFEYNASLSSEIGQNYCSNICSSEIATDPNAQSYFQRICR